MQGSKNVRLFADTGGQKCVWKGLNNQKYGQAAEAASLKDSPIGAQSKEHDEKHGCMKAHESTKLIELTLTRCAVVIIALTGPFPVQMRPLQLLGLMPANMDAPDQGSKA